MLILLFLFGVCVGSFLNVCILRIPKQATVVSGRSRLIEGITGLLFVLCHLTYGFSVRTIIYCLFGSALIVGAAIDQKYTYVPDRIPLFIAALAIVLHRTGQAPPLLSCVFGSLLVAGSMLLLSLMTHGGIGGGDIKLFAVSGFLLGAGQNILACLLGYILASFFYVPLLMQKKLSRQAEIPMVPFFAVTFIIAALWGDPILHWYLP